MKKLIEFIGITYTEGGDMRITLTYLKKFDIVKPVALSAEEKKDEVNMIIFTEEVKAYVK